MNIKYLLILSIIYLLFYQSKISAQSFTAKYKKDIVDSVAKEVDSSALLLIIKSDSVFIDGTSLSWSYQYLGESEVNYFFHSTLDSVIYDSLNKISVYGLSDIWVPWIDSDSALFIAENQGGKEFRNRNPHYKIETMLTQPRVGAPIFEPIWYIHYRLLDNPDSTFSININATDSSRITVIKELNYYQPQRFKLFQNYPNPFNPTTTIKYSISITSFVNIKILDVLGREISILVNEEEKPGNYSITFNASKFSSGLYFCRMQAGHVEEAIKLLLIK